MPAKTIELGAHDSAVIIRADGTWEIQLGLGEKEPADDEIVNHGALVTTGLCLLLSDEARVQALIDEVEASNVEIQVEDATKAKIQAN